MAASVCRTDMPYACRHAELLLSAGIKVDVPFSDGGRRLLRLRRTVVPWLGHGIIQWKSDHSRVLGDHKTTAAFQIPCAVPDVAMASAPQIGSATPARAFVVALRVPSTPIR